MCCAATTLQVGVGHRVSCLFQCPYGLYSEQLTGTAFTVPRAGNQRTWFFRIRPAVAHEKFVQVEHEAFQGGVSKLKDDPNQVRDVHLAMFRNCSHVRRCVFSTVPLGPHPSREVWR